MVAEQTPNEAKEPVAEPQYEQTINGAKVVFRRKYPLRIAGALPQLLAGARESVETDYHKRVPLLKVSIESWSHPGDPSTDEAYEDLDIFDDIGPMTGAAAAIINYRFDQRAKAKN